MRNRLIVVVSAVLLAFAAVAAACADSNSATATNDGGVPPFLDLDAGPGCAVLSIMQARCTSCHGDPPTEGAPMSLSSLATLRAPSSQHPGETNAQRALVRMTSHAMPPKPADPATESEIAALHSWIDLGMPECSSDVGPSESSPNQIPQNELFQCPTETQGSSPGRLHRLSQREWEDSLGTEIGVGWGAANPFYPNATDQYGPYTSSESIDDATLGLYLDPAFAGGKLALEIQAELTGLSAKHPEIACMLKDAHPDDACVQGFAVELLQHHVLFRPPNDGETSRLVGFAKTVLAGEKAIADRPHEVGRIATAAWLTSGALFHQELGGAVDGSGRARLTDWELGQAVAFTIGNRGLRTPPSKYNSGSGTTYTAPVADGSLADIALATENGTIGSPQTLDALFRAHAGGEDLARADLAPNIGNPASRVTHGQWWLSEKMRDFFRQWLGYEAVRTIFKERPGRTSEWDADTSNYGITSTSWSQLLSGYYKHAITEDTLIEQTDDLIARIVNSDQDVLKTLLTSTQVYVNATWQDFTALKGTARPYGIGTDVPDARDGRWITLPASERAGILTHPAWLAAHGGNLDDDPSLIHRGHWIRENLLCQYIPPLSEVRVPAMVGPSAPDQTARSRVATATASETCQGCHKLMNSLGEPFEIYNHAGFLRKFDHDGSPPNGTTNLVDMPDPALNGPITSAIDLSQKLAATDWTKRCFIRQTFRYIVGRDETRADACSLVRMEKAYDVKGSVYSLWSAAITSDAYLYRRAGGN